MTTYRKAVPNRPAADTSGLRSVCLGCVGCSGLCLEIMEMALLPSLILARPEPRQ